MEDRLEGTLRKKRDRATIWLPHLKRALKDYLADRDPDNYQEFLLFAQEVVDSYMMHECKLGRDGEYLSN